MWEVLILEFVCCVFFALALYKKYGSFTNRPFYVTIAVLTGWILCFYIVFLTPNDVAQASQCNVPVTCDAPKDGDGESSNHVSFDDVLHPEALTAPCEYDSTGREIVPYNVLVILWTIVYWTTIFLTWGVYPIMQTYSMTGEFTFADKLRTSIKSNLLLYSIMGAVLAVVGIVYLIQTNFSFSDLPATAAAAANAYGLFLLISLLGHGLVNVPRRLWRTTNRGMNLKRYQFEVAQLDSALLDAKAHLTTTLKKVRKADEITGESDVYRKYIDIMIAKCPEEFQSIPFGEGNLEISYQKLASLHETLMREDHMVRMYESQFKEAMEGAIMTEDILNCFEQEEWRINWSFRKRRVHGLAKLCDVLECLWFCYIEARIVQIICLALMLLSICVVFSELLFFVCRVDLSVFSRFIRLMRMAPAFLLQGSIMLPVLYLAWCSFSSLFKLRLFNYYHIVPGNSDSNSLLFSAAYLCRLTSPLAYNFMQMAHYTNTAFVNVMGTMDVDEIDATIGDYFQTFFPMILLPFVFLTLFNVYGRIMNLLSIRRFQFDDDFNDTLIEDGREIVAEEREKMQRQYDDGEEMGDVAVTGRNRRGVSFTDDGDPGEEELGGATQRIPMADSGEGSPRQRRPSSGSDTSSDGFGASVRRFLFGGPPRQTADHGERDIGSEAISSESSRRSSEDWGQGAFPNMFSSPSRSNSSSGSRYTSRISRPKSALPTFDTAVGDDPWDDDDNPFAL